MDCKTAKQMWDKLQDLYDEPSDFEEEDLMQPDEETKPPYDNPSPWPNDLTLNHFKP